VDWTDWSEWLDEDDPFWSFADDLESHLDEAVKTISRELEQYGYDIIEGYSSEESAVEALEANDHWRFDEDGDLL
jgi:N-acetyl-anhydromuramyl-L-alanine amidase AmpD